MGVSELLQGPTHFSHIYCVHRYFFTTLGVTFWDAFSYTLIQMKYSMSQGTTAQSVSLDSNFPPMIITSLLQAKANYKIKKKRKLACTCNSLLQDESLSQSDLVICVSLEWTLERELQFSVSLRPLPLQQHFTSSCFTAVIQTLSHIIIQMINTENEQVHFFRLLSSSSLLLRLSVSQRSTSKTSCNLEEAILKTA